MLFSFGSRCSPGLVACRVVVRLGLAATAVATAGRAADSGAEWTSRPTSQLQQLAQHAIERQQFGEAVPALAELDRRFRESDDPAIVQAREGILYFLGVGRLQAGQFEDAAAALEEFLQRYPEARPAPFARLFHGDALFYQGRFADARAAYETLRARPDALHALDAAQQLGLWDRLSDCCYAAQDWAGGVEVFRELERVARRQTDGGPAVAALAKAGSYLLQAAIAREELEAALAALPVLTGDTGSTRHDLSLNLALMRGGDAFYERSRHGEALYFYQHVLPPPDLSRYWEREIERLEAEQAGRVGLGLFAGRSQEIANQLAVARQRLGQISETIGAEVPDYTPALQFRIARCYLARERSFEAYWAFDRLRATAGRPGGEDYAEEALYGCVKTAVATGQVERVRAATRAYLDRRDFVRFLGDVAHERVQSERAAGETAVLPELAREFVQRVREQPELSEAAKLLYVAGSTLLGIEDLATLRQCFEPLAREFAGHAFADGAHYWLGLATVFAGEFAEALARFETVRREFARGAYAEDAAFRIGVCRFGLLEYAEAERVLDAFLADHPQSRLASEAHALRGDLAAAEGRIEEALAAYGAAETAGGRLDPPNLAYINHAIFQGGKLLAANRRWAEMATWFEAYINRWGRQGRMSDALYELGRAQEALGRPDEMLESWFRAILRFGNDPEDAGPDLMLAHYPDRYAAVTGAPPVAALREALARAEAQGETTLVLRLAYALRALGADEGETPRATAEQFDAASAAVLVRIAQSESVTAPALALAAAEAAVGRGGDSPFAEQAWHLIGDLRTTAGDAEGALAAYREAAERFPASPRAARVRLREGDRLRDLGRYEAAIAAYRIVLQTRQWRGAAWAEANYKIGRAHFDAGELKEAFGFFQRVYVLYSGMAEWAAPAYLQSGLALEALGRLEDAAATYRELLSKEQLGETAAGREAAARLAALAGGGAEAAAGRRAPSPARARAWSTRLMVARCFSGRWTGLIRGRAGGRAGPTFMWLAPIAGSGGGRTRRRRAG